LARLFATDLDGTLVDRDGRILPRDAAAIRRAMAEGVTVTIATGRLTTGTLPIAHELRLDAPLVCADGAVLVRRTQTAPLRRTGVGRDHVDHLLDKLTDSGAARFVFTHDAIHACERSAPHHGYVRGWSPALTSHDDVRRAPAWRADQDAAVMVVGIGPEEAIRDIEAHVLASSELDALTFSIDFGRFHVVRVIRKGVSKGSALTALADELGIALSDVAVVGDWHNDTPMFEIAGRSFAMPHAPPALRAVATDVLGDEATTEGGIALALERWLGITLP